jgi:hypothetical protein
LSIMIHAIMLQAPVKILRKVHIKFLHRCTYRYIYCLMSITNHLKATLRHFLCLTRT